MATRLSHFFRRTRIELDLSPGQLARQLGYTNVTGGANRITRFEETGNVNGKLLVRLAETLGIEPEQIEQLVEQDRADTAAAWEEWANEPVQPHLVVRIMSAVYVQRPIPDEIVGDEAAMIEHAAGVARHFRAAARLVLSRRFSIALTKDGGRGGIEEAAADRPIGCYLRVKGSKTPFAFRVE